jgi:hypothetical protein
MSKREEILTVLLLMCAAGWALEYRDSHVATTNHTDKDQTP